MKELKTINKYFIRYKWHLLLGIAFVILSNLFRLMMPGTIREALDYVLQTANEIKGTRDSELMDAISSATLSYGLSLLGFAVLMGIFMYFMRQTIIVMSRLIEYDLRKDIYEHYQKLDLAFYKRNKTGDLMSRVSEDVSKVRMYMGPALLYGINLSALVIMAIYCMLRVNVTLTLYTLLPLPFLSISIYMVSSVINRKSEEIQIQLAKLTSVSQEVYSGIRVIKSYVKENSFGKHFLEENTLYKDKSLSLAKTNALFHPLMILLTSASTLLTVVIGGIQVSKGNATPGNIAEFVIYVNMLTWPVTSIGWIASIVQQAEASQKRINEFLKTTPQIQNKPIVNEHIQGKIEFNNVSFTYPDTGIEALKNINFTLKKGQKMAILGRTASGKSTIADLLLRMYDVTSGEIKIDGHNISSIDLENLRNSIGYVPQDVFLFSDTITDNIGFGQLKPDPETVKEYAGYAAVHKDILMLPENYDTLVGERGVTLSGGQKQRISIARAFIKNPEIVILDDCLSAVDTDTEQQIISYLDKVLNDKTAIIITHRIHFLVDFDLIMVIDEGEIVEMGTHNELLHLKGAYFELVENQMGEQQIKV